MTEPRSIAARTAIVTGAARGIGLAIASRFHRLGVSVALVDVDADAAAHAAQSMGTRSLAIRADVTKSADVQQAVNLTVEQFGGLDIVVNNAGICPLSPFEETSESEWDLVLDVNLKGAFLFCQMALPYLRRAKSRGRIINIASVAGQMGGLAAGVHYAASKAGLIGLSKSLARLLAPDGITVNCVAPGTTSTDLTAVWPSSTRDRVRAGIPLGRLAEPEEVAAAAAFLASDEAAYITGATIDLNGGLNLR